MVTPVTRATAWTHMTQCKNLILVITLVAALTPRAEGGPAENQFKVAAAHYKNNRWQLAVDEFEIFLKQHPEHALRGEAIFRIAESLTQLADYVQADAFYRQYLEQLPPHGTSSNYAAKAEFRRGELAYFSGQAELAMDRLQQFREHFPQDPHNQYALLYLGDLGLATEDAVLAQKWFAQLLAEFSNGPLEPEAQFGLARALESLGHQEEAVAKYQELVEQNGPVRRQAQLQLAIAAYRQEDFTATERHVSSFVDDSHHDQVRTRALFWLGMSHLARENWLDAANLFSAAVSNQPQHSLAPEIHFRAGEAYRQAAYPEDAQAHFLAVIQHCPESEFVDKARLAWAQLAWDQQDFDQIHTLEEEFSSDASNSETHNNIRELAARSLLVQQKYPEAVQCFQDWLHSTAGMLPNDRAWYLCGLAQLGNRQYQDALKSLDRVNETTYLEHAIQVARASAWIGLEQYDQAIEPLQAYLASQPQGADAAKCQSDLAMCLAKTEQLVEASRWWNRFRREYPNHSQQLPVAHFLAETAMAQGDRTWAAELFGFLAEDGNPSNYVQTGNDGLLWLQTSGDNDSLAAFQQLMQQNRGSRQAPLAALARARAQEREKRWEGALASYYLIIDQSPDSDQLPDALFGAARLHDRLDQDADAYRLLTQLLNAHPDYRHRGAVLYALAWVHNDLGRPDESATVFRQIYEGHHDSSYWADAAYRLAEKAIASKDFDQVQQICQNIVEQGCTDDLLGHVYYLQGRSAALAGRWEDVSPPLESLIERLPQHELILFAHYWVAESVYQQGNYDDASRRFAQLKNRLDDAEAFASQKWTAIIPLRQAQALAQTNHWSDALAIAKQVVENFPDFRQLYEVHYLIGRCLAHEGEFSAAREAYELVVASSSGSQSETAAMAQWMIGETYFHQKQHDKAIRAYLRVEILYQYPRWQALGLLQAGKCYEMKGSWPEAVRLYARVLKEFPQSDEANQAANRMQLASRDELN